MMPTDTVLDRVKKEIPNLDALIKDGNAIYNHTKSLINN